MPSLGTTTQLRGNVPRYEHFNPRSLVGNDRIWQNTLPSRWKFQSTFPRGERRGPYLIFLSPCRFQSTFPRGERHLCWLVAVKHIHFNPRSLVGNDYIPVGTYTIVEISIHVPSWGTTIFTRRQPPCILFQSTFPRGERRAEIKAFKSLQEFQSTFPRGERQMQGSDGADCKDFNPRSLVGND